jgi:two-component system cell cycle sensor histidine kinase/response regulator CckA
LFSPAKEKFIICGAKGNTGHMKTSVRILHLDDDPKDADLIQSTLAADRIVCSLTHVRNKADFIAALEAGGFDLVLAEFAVPEFDGLSALKTVRSKWPDLPCILVSGTSDEEITVESIRNGATDFIVKNRISRLAPAVHRTLKETEERIERRRIEEQAIQSQKMEVFGQLAAGVAHDFNNILGVILGYSDLMMEKLAATDPMRKFTGEIHHAAVRASALTRQLLLFCRKQAMQPVVLDLNQVVEGLNEMLQRLIDENIQLTFVPGNEIGRARADAGHVGQVLMNLVVNARDAMPKGGKLIIATSNVVLDETYTQGHTGVKPGKYVMLSVSDTGVGMSDQVKAHLFEAFFTTKPKGKGTGLGLATSQTIVRECGGHIGLYSELGKGTTFKVYFPRVDLPLDSRTEFLRKLPLSRGTETLLLVEDEPSLRSLARNVLQEQGYQVLSASNGQDGLNVAREHKGAPIRLIITDVIMPQMGGQVMAEELKATNPHLRILFTSGYTDDAVAHQCAIEAGMEFLAKPYTPAMLARKVRGLLDETGFPSSGATLSASTASNNSLQRV